MEVLSTSDKPYGRCLGEDGQNCKESAEIVTERAD